MAVAKVHSIHATLSAAIDYIIDPKKTDRQEYVYGYNCTPQMAFEKFEKTRLCTGKLLSNNGKRHRSILAQHIIQSFAPDDNVTPEIALEIGKKLMDELCGGDYEYVIATHIEKDCIHNHIIVNNWSNKTLKSFEAEHNRSKNLWKKIREISDELCKDYGLSVVSNPERGQSKSHYEWEQDKKGVSWKTKLREMIDDCIKTAVSFEDFLEKMQDNNYEVKRGKHISFRAAGQERFTRAKTIGYYYQETQIKARIARRIAREEYLARIAAQRSGAARNPYVSDGFVRDFVVIDKRIEQSQGLKNWALVQNMKNASKIINQLAEKGITSERQLDERIMDLYESRAEMRGEIRQLDKKIYALSSDLKKLRTYRKLQPVNEGYKKAKNKEKYFEAHEAELHRYTAARENVKGLLNENGKLPPIAVLEEQIEALKQRYAQIAASYDNISSDVAELETIKRNYEKMVVAGKLPASEQHEEKHQPKKKKDIMEL